MTENILAQDESGWYRIEVPVVSSGMEVDMLRYNQSKSTDYHFSSWLKGENL